MVSRARRSPNESAPAGPHRRLAKSSMKKPNAATCPAARRWVAPSSPGFSATCDITRRDAVMPTKSANVKNEKQYEALKDKGMSKQRAARIANSPDASKHGGEKSHS